jgi:hypothetical protein
MEDMTNKKTVPKMNIIEAFLVAMLLKSTMGHFDGCPSFSAFLDLALFSLIPIGMSNRPATIKAGSTI